jgi:hypothetical protein
MFAAQDDYNGAALWRRITVLHPNRSMPLIHEYCPITTFKGYDNTPPLAPALSFFVNGPQGRGGATPVAPMPAGKPHVIVKLASSPMRC